MPTRQDPWYVVPFASDARYFKALTILQTIRERQQSLTGHTVYTTRFPYRPELLQTIKSSDQAQARAILSIKS